MEKPEQKKEDLKEEREQLPGEEEQEQPAGKKLFRKNQLIITALAVMIAAAGYINYTDSIMPEGEVADTSQLNNSQVMKEIESLDHDLSEEELQHTGTLTETPGEAVLTGASTYMAQVKINREQVRSQNKEALNEIINNTALSEAERQSAVQSLVDLSEIVEKETAAEQLLEAQGFAYAVVNLTGETADVVIPQSEISDAQRAQIEDIVTRKAEIGVEKIVITPMSREKKTTPTVTPTETPTPTQSAAPTPAK